MPKGGASSLTPVYAGLREDLDSFLKAYLQLESVRFSDYKKIFQHRGMIRIFNGRSNSAEIIEFNECLLIHCLPYMEEYICKGVPRSLKERLFGLYSLYTFFYVQQESHVVKVRMDPDAVRNFKKLTELLLELKIYDAYMACLKLLEDKAIKHVAFIAIHDPANFKRFYTDEKVSGVTLRTNLNDPLGNVKALVDSDLFNKLGIMRREYKKLKEKAKFIGNPLEDVQEKIREIIVQYTEEFETLQGVDEIINTDHSFEQLASRGMLRTSIKEHAHSADLKLARYRRHRSVTPLDMPTDSFDYMDEEFVPEIKDVKRIKSESSDPSEPPIKRRTRRNTRHTAAKPEDVPEITISGGIVASQPFKFPKPEPLDSHENKFAMDSVMDTVSSMISNIEDRELDEPPIRKRRQRVPKKRSNQPDETKPEDIQLDVIVNYLELINKSNEGSSTQHPMEVEQPTSEINGVQLYVDDSEAASTPKSIIKTRKADLKRRVSFRFNEVGDVDTTVFEIPSRAAMEEASKTGKKKKNKKKDNKNVYSDIPEAFPVRVVENHNEPIAELLFDDADMFRPLEGEQETDLVFGNFGMESDLELAIDEDNI
ncbi:unnamed protein product [Caenorhabditis brenneri]